MENFRITLRRKFGLSDSEFGFVSNYGVRNSKNYSAKGLFVSFWSITKENRQPAFASFWTDKMKGIPFLHKDYTVVAVRYTG